MKKYLPILFCFLFACNMADDKKEKSVNDNKHFASDVLKLAIDYPYTWTLNFSPDSLQPNALLTLQTPLENEKDAYQENLSVYHEHLPVKISDSLFHQAAMAQIKIANQNLEVSNKGKKTFGKNNFHELFFSFQKDSVQYNVHGYTLLKDSTGYTFNFTTVQQNEEKYMPQVESVLKNFKPQ